MPLGMIIKEDEKAVFELRSLYQNYGYRRYKMSKFEEYDLYVRNKDFLISNEVITFTDASGKLLALKPDVTLSIIKNSKDSGKAIQKLYYDENVYRMMKSNKEFREIMQSGLECIGEIGEYEICEALLLALKSLEMISDDYVLDMSYMDIILSVLTSSGLNRDEGEAVLTALGQKNTDEIEKICKAASVDSTRIISLINICGKPENTFSELARICRSGQEKYALKKFNSIISYLSECGYSEKINVDFSIINDMNYYNGVVFKGYVNGIPSSILSGGQYDNLMLKMGRKDKGVGFAVYMNLLQRFNENKDEFDVDKVLLKSDFDSAEKITDAVNSLSEDGSSVLVENAIPENLKYRSAYRLTESGAVII